MLLPPPGFMAQLCSWFLSLVVLRALCISSLFHFYLGGAVRWRVAMSEGIAGMNVFLGFVGLVSGLPTT